MKRWEYTQKDGSLTESQDKNTVAKMFINTEDKTNRFYVMLSGGELFDPQETSGTYLKRRQWRFRLVPYEVYDLYLRYLNKKQKALKLQAERMI